MTNLKFIEVIFIANLQIFTNISDMSFIEKSEEVMNKNKSKIKNEQKPQSQFVIFFDNNKYFFKKMYPNLDSIDKVAKML
jgi:hypothetical protein